MVLVLFFVPLRELYRYDLLLFSIHQNAPLFISETKKKKDIISLCLDVKKVREIFLQRQRKYLPATHTALRGLHHHLALLHFDPVTLSLSVALCVKFSNILWRKIKYENRLNFEALRKKFVIWS